MTDPTETIPPPERDPQVLSLLEREATSDAYDAAIALSELLFVRHAVRPTVNSVRSLLKRGSNTTIQKAVDTFWKRLHLRTQVSIPAIPVPEGVAELFGQLWRAAVNTASEQFEEDRREWRAQVRAAEESRVAAEQRADSYWDMAEQARLAEATAVSRAEAAEKLVESAQEARLRAEREADDARLSAEAFRDEARASHDRADAAIQAADARALQAIEKIEAQYEGLRHHLLEETARERDQLKEKHDAAMAEIEQERETFRTQRHRLEMGQADLRDQLNQSKRDAANALATSAAQTRDIERQSQEITRLNSQIERLMRLLESIPRGEANAAAGESGEDSALLAMMVIMRDVHADLRSTDDDAVVLSDWRMESIERYQDNAGLDQNAGALFDAALAEIGLAWK